MVSLFGHIFHLVIKVLFLPNILTYLIVYNLQKNSLMQNHLRTSSNNTLASLDCEIKCNLENWHQCFITRPLVITMLRYLALLTSSMDLLIHTKHNLLMVNNIDQIWFWKTIPITFSQGCSLFKCHQQAYTYTIQLTNTASNNIYIRNLDTVFCLKLTSWVYEALPITYKNCNIINIF